MSSKTNYIYVVYIISFLDLFAIGLTFPLFSNYLRELGISHTVIGLLGSTYSGVQVLSGPLIGGWSDVRSRKSVLKTTVLLCGICYGLLGLTSSIYLIFLLRFILGVIKHTQSICKAVITDLVPPNEHTMVFGRSAAFASFGFILGPFISGHLSEIPNGFTYLSTFTAILYFINFSVASFLPEDSATKKKLNNRSILAGVKYESAKIVRELKSIDWNVHWDGFLLRFFFGLSLSFYFSYHSLYLKEKYELPDRYIGYIISYFSTVGMLSAFFINIINGFYEGDNTCYTRLVHFYAVLAICFISISVTQNLWIFLILLIPFSIVSTTLRVVSMELLLNKSDETHRGSLSGASNSIMSIARFVSPLATGLASDIFNGQPVMWLAVIPASLGMVISWFRRRSVYYNEVKNK